jgi:phosphoribosyl 1,2-cyclic phosphodiesterase
VQFHVLASGSSGNACVLDVDGFGVLVDFGLSPRLLAQRMQRCGIAWNRLHAVLLTHAHNDHWQAATLAHFARLRLPVYCHADHVQEFGCEGRALAASSPAGLVRHYEPGARLQLHPNCSCVPISLPHDAAMTSGFRFEGTGWAIGYAADLGSWHSALARQFADVDLLALEFNHDVALQLASGRHPLLIRRILGDNGHLSNEQAARMFEEILRLSTPRRLRHLVQLHLSQECNRPDLARMAAKQVLDLLQINISIHTTQQQRAGPTIALGDRQADTELRPGGAKDLPWVQPLLPFREWS